MAVVVATTGCGGSGTTPDSGSALFATHCLSCHADASGTRPPTGGTSLVKARNAPEVIASAIAADVGGMRRLAGLSPQELERIAAYLGEVIPPPSAAPAPAPSPSPSPAPATPGAPNSGLFTGTDTFNAAARADVVVTGLNAPWGAAVLPDGRLLVTQRTAGSLAIVDLAAGRVAATVPTGLAVGGTSGQGGLMDVALDPAFAGNQRVYWTFTEVAGGLSGTAVARGRLVGTALQEVQVIWRQRPKVAGDAHYGSRLAFRGDGTLFVTLGDRRQDDPDQPTRDAAQNAATTLGKVVRLNTDGNPAAGNPSLGSGSLPEIWSLGHRNPQGAAIHPVTGELWVSEHGALGGDEINIARAGGNYGWPFVSYGCNYGASGGASCRIGGGTHAPAYVEPVTSWVPQSIAPSGIAFDSIGTRYPGWAGSLFVGAMAGIPNGGQALWRLTLSGQTITAREVLLQSLGERIRDVVQTPDGWIYLLTDSGRILRLNPR